MNKFATLLAAAGVLLGCPGAQAQYAANDLVLGFDRVDNGGSGPQPADYVINLGNFQSAVGVGGSTTVSLTTLFNPGTFNGLYGSLGSGVSMSVVGGNGALTGRDLFTTVLRGGAGTPGAPGSSAPGALLSSFMASGANDVAAMMGASGLNLGAGQSMTMAQADPNSFNTWVLSTTPPTFGTGTGLDPRGSTGGSVLYEDLYRARDGVSGNSFEYVGFFTLDTSGSPSLSFTPAAVPEPGTGVLLGGGFLLLLMRLRSARRNG
jgi:hypothetical protein